MNTPKTPTAGAIRAAKAIFGPSEDGLWLTEAECAEIIDRETHAPELLNFVHEIASGVLGRVSPGAISEANRLLARLTANTEQSEGGVE